MFLLGTLMGRDSLFEKLVRCTMNEKNENQNCFFHENFYLRNIFNKSQSGIEFEIRV